MGRGCLCKLLKNWRASLRSKGLGHSTEGAASSFHPTPGAVHRHNAWGMTRQLWQAALEGPSSLLWRTATLLTLAIKCNYVIWVLKKYELPVWLFLYFLFSLFVTIKPVVVHITPLFLSFFSYFLFWPRRLIGSVFKCRVMTTFLLSQNQYKEAHMGYVNFMFKMYLNGWFLYWENYSILLKPNSSLLFDASQGTYTYFVGMS